MFCWAAGFFFKKERRRRAWWVVGLGLVTFDGKEEGVSLVVMRISLAA